MNSMFLAYDLYKQGESFKWSIVRLVRAAIFYPPGSLWYVWASIVGIIIIYKLYGKMHGKRIWIIGILLYFIGLLGNSYYFVLMSEVSKKIVDGYLKVAVTTRNGLFVGFPLLLLGIELARYEGNFRGKKKLLSIIMMMVLSFGLMQYKASIIIEKNVGHENTVLILYPIIASLFFIILLNIKWVPQKMNMIVIRKLSMDIYFMHRPILTCMRYFNKWRGIELSHLAEFWILLIISLIICIPMVICQKKKYRYI